MPSRNAVLLTSPSRVPNIIDVLNLLDIHIAVGTAQASERAHKMTAGSHTINAADWPIARIGL